MSKELLFFIDSMAGGGAERVISVLVPQFIKDGFKVGIVMLRDKPIAYPLPPEIKLYYIEQMPVNLYGKIQRRTIKLYNKCREKLFLLLKKDTNEYPWNEHCLYFYSKFAIPLRYFLKEHSGATAYGFMIRSSVVLAMAARGNKSIRTVYCERSNPARPNISPRLVKLRDRYYRYYDDGIFQTEEVMQYFHKIQGRKKLILNPIVDGLPTPWNGEREKKIVTFCRLGPEKNLLMLIDAFACISKQYPDYFLHIYGEGPEKEKLQRQIDFYGLREKAKLFGFAPDIHKRIQKAAIFVSTSDYEGLSNSLMESMALGLPCISTDCAGGGARILIKDHVNGIIVPTKDAQKLASAMNEILGNDELSRKLSEHAVEIKNKCKISEIASEWESFANLGG